VNDAVLTCLLVTQHDPITNLRGEIIMAGEDPVDKFANLHLGFVRESKSESDALIQLNGQFLL